MYENNLYLCRVCCEVGVMRLLLRFCTIAEEGVAVPKIGEAAESLITCVAPRSRTVFSLSFCICCVLS